MPIAVKPAILLSVSFSRGHQFLMVGRGADETFPITRLRIAQAMENLKKYFETENAARLFAA